MEMLIKEFPKYERPVLREIGNIPEVKEIPGLMESISNLNDAFKSEGKRIESPLIGEIAYALQAAEECKPTQSFYALLTLLRESPYKPEAEAIVSDAMDVIHQILTNRCGCRLAKY